MCDNAVCNMQNNAFFSSRSRLAIGVDIGASRLKFVLLAEDGTVAHRDERDTPRRGSGEEMARDIAALTESFRNECVGQGRLATEIGFTTPQFTDGPDWIQRHANNMPGLNDFPLRPALAAGLDAEPLIVYDSSAAAIAERLFGLGRDVQRLLTLSIGTGISAGVITERGLVDFNWGGTGDSGQIIVDPLATVRCSCGGLGCLESIASAPAIVAAGLAAAEARDQGTMLAKVVETTGSLEVSDIVTAAEAGDQAAAEVMERAGHAIGIALASYLHIFRPERVVLCGGVARAAEQLLRPVRKTLALHASPWYLSQVRGIDISAFPSEGAAMGAAAVALRASVVADGSVSPITEVRL
jgi:glucokinase